MTEHRRRMARELAQQNAGHSWAELLTEALDEIDDLVLNAVRRSGPFAGDEPARRRRGRK